MAQIKAYLMFGGNCLEAMNFYKQCFGGEFDCMTYENSPMPIPEEVKSKIMHSRLKNQSLELMAADDVQHKSVHSGNMVTLNVTCNSQEEIKRIFKGLAQGGRITMPLQDTFWGSKFGTLTDKYGIKWMLNCD